MKKFTLHLLLFVSFITITSLNSLACSEIGKKEFKLDKTVSEKCGNLAQEIINQVGRITYPELQKGEHSDAVPSAPFQVGDLNHHQGKIIYSPSETLEKTKSQDRQATFPITISTKVGNWECLYCVTFEVSEDKCLFKTLAMNHCAGGVSYPSK